MLSSRAYEAFCSSTIIDILRASTPSLHLDCKIVCKHTVGSESWFTYQPIQVVPTTSMVSFFMHGNTKTYIAVGFGMRECIAASTDTCIYTDMHRNHLPRWFLECRVVLWMSVGFVAAHPPVVPFWSLRSCRSSGVQSLSTKPCRCPCNLLTLVALMQADCIYLLHDAVW